MQRLRFAASAVALLAVVLVVAGPAGATPTGTVPNGNAPYMTPAGNTTSSSITLSGAGYTWAVGGFNHTCTVKGLGYVPAVDHTSVYLTSIAFTSCVSTLGTIVVDTSCVNSATPWVLHIRGTVVNSSVAGTRNYGCPQVVTLTALGGLVDCDLTIHAGTSSGAA